MKKTLDGNNFFLIEWNIYILAMSQYFYQTMYFNLCVQSIIINFYISYYIEVPVPDNYICKFVKTILTNKQKWMQFNFYYIIYNVNLNLFTWMVTKPQKCSNSCFIYDL